MSAALQRVGSLLRQVLPDFRDVHVYGGGALLVIGAWKVYPPAAWILGGLLLLFLGLRRR